MGDASELCYAPSTSLLDHCRQLGEKHDPTRFADSVPGGIWALPECRGGDECVAIKRVEHKVNGDGLIFTPQDHANFPQGWTHNSASAMDTEGRAIDCLP